MLDDQNDKIIFLLKTMKKEYLEDTMKKGRFCFCHPSVFSQWEDTNAAQFDHWEAHSAYEAIHVVFAPIIGEKENGMPIYGPGKKIAEKGIVRTQTDFVRYSPICCFRAIDQSEVEMFKDGIYYSLGDIANRIMLEFGHDSYIIIQAVPFLERLKRAVNFTIAMAVVYEDVLNNYHFNVEEKFKEMVEQLFRKDKKYKWQKEYRIVLPPSKETKTIIEMGSIEDIAVCGNLKELI